MPLKLSETRQHGFKHNPYPHFSLCSHQSGLLLPCLYLFTLDEQVSFLRVAAVGFSERDNLQCYPLKKMPFPSLTGQQSELREQWCLISPSSLATVYLSRVPGQGCSLALLPFPSPTHDRMLQAQSCTSLVLGTTTAVRSRGQWWCQILKSVPIHSIPSLALCTYLLQYCLSLEIGDIEFLLQLSI